MKVNANTIRPGHVLEQAGKLYVVTKIQIIQPGKGGAFVQVDMKDVKTGNKTNERYRTQESVERVRVEEMDFQFLFADGDHYTFMNNESFEQVIVEGELIGDPARFLQEGMAVTMNMYEGQALSVTLPSHVTMEITEADAVVKGQTASSSYKNAILENGVRTLVPPYMTPGTRIVISTEDGSFVEKAKD